MTKEMTKNYLVKLTPHDKFFFGGENTFGDGDKRNYFVKSNYYPQQTTLLGLIRYQLMVQNKNGIFENNKIGKPEDAAKLISHKSFDINDTNFAFRKIKELSPVFIVYGNEEFLFHGNKEYQWVESEGKIEKKEFILRQFAKKSSGNSTVISGKKFIPYLEKFKVKDVLPDLLVNKNLSIKKFYDYDKDKEKPEANEKDKKCNGIFIEHKQIGIRKNYEGKSEENAFYVQYFYKLIKGYSFAFILKLEDGVEFKTNELVSIGGEQSKFRMEVSEKNIEFENIVPDYEQSINSNKIVLVSDAFVSNEILEVCDFAVTETIDFRSLRSTVNTINYSKLNRSGNGKDGVSKTGKYNFFKKGSVFYGEDTNKIIKYFNDKIAARKIGYNHYGIVNKKEA